MNITIVVAMFAALLVSTTTAITAGSAYAQRGSGCGWGRGAGVTVNQQINQLNQCAGNSFC